MTLRRLTSVVVRFSFVTFVFDVRSASNFGGRFFSVAPHNGPTGLPLPPSSRKFHWRGCATLFCPSPENGEINFFLISSVDAVFRPIRPHPLPSTAKICDTSGGEDNFLRGRSFDWPPFSNGASQRGVPGGVRFCILRPIDRRPYIFRLSDKFSAGRR